MKTGFRILAAAIVCVALPALAALDYPTGSVKILVQFPPGGAPDTVARVLAEGLSEALGKPFVVDNRPGVNGNIATDLVAKANPDGHTLLIASSASMAITPNIYKKLPFDLAKDLAPITLAASFDFVMLAAPDFPADTVQELIKLAIANPGKLNFASSGFGSEHHLSGELFNLLTGARLTHVPYKGFGPATVDVIGKQVEIMFGSVPAALPFIKGGKLKALAVTGPTRAPELPNVPTFMEAGVPGLEVRSWVGLMAPARTPEPVIDRLNLEVAKILRLPRVVDRFGTMGLGVMAQGPKEFAARMAADTRMWARVVKDAGIKGIE